jgi:hypothetical protein
MSNSQTELTEFGMTHESALVESFVLSVKKSRWSSMLCSKARSKILGRLASPIDFVDQHMSKISSNSTVEDIEKLLSKMGVNLGDLCWVISDWQGIDKHEVTVHDGLCSLVGLGLGSILSIKPGVVAYYESELGDKFLLHNKFSDGKASRATN